MPKLTPQTAALRRATIVEAARRVFADTGFGNASMQRLAKETGMSVGGIYRHFPSKADLIAAVVSGRDGAPDPAAREPERAAELLDRLLSYVDLSTSGQEQARLTTFIWAETLTDEAVRSLAVERHHALHALLVQAARDGGSSMPAPNLAAAIDAVLAALVGFSAMASAGYPVDFPRFADTLRRGLGAAVGAQ